MSKQEERESVKAVIEAGEIHINNKVLTMQEASTVHKLLSSIFGKIGRKAFEKKYSKEQRREWTKLGGRPKKVINS